MLNINFYCRISKAKSNRFAPIQMSIIINGTRCEITLPRQERPSEFHGLIAQRKGNDLKQYLDMVRSKVN